MFDDWDRKDTALAIQGVGSIANAYGDYRTNKTRNKLSRDMFEYEKSLDEEAKLRLADAQTNLDNAWDDTYLNPDKKKKKKKKTNTIEDETTSATAIA